MFDFIFLVLLSLTSTATVGALLCADTCDYSGYLNNSMPSPCTFVTQPASKRYCSLHLMIDYVSGSFHTSLNSVYEPEISVIASFSLYDDSKIRTYIRFFCVDSDKCDVAFIDDVLKNDWSKIQTQMKSLRGILADMLFNSSNFYSNGTCLAAQPCSGEGFCSSYYQISSNAPSAVYNSGCSNPNNDSYVEWHHFYEENVTVESLYYICNNPSCATLSVAESTMRLMQRNYILPFNITLLSEPTTSGVSTTTIVRTTTARTTTMLETSTTARTTTMPKTSTATTTMTETSTTPRTTKMTETSTTPRTTTMPETSTRARTTTMPEMSTTARTTTMLETSTTACTTTMPETATAKTTMPETATAKTTMPETATAKTTMPETATAMLETATATTISATSSFFVHTPLKVIFTSALLFFCFS